MSNSEPIAPLEGIRILDFTRYVVGAVVTRRLADLGADVVKVERPAEGDMLRSIPPRVGGQGIWHLLENAGKFSICGDSDEAEYRALVAELAGTADVVVTSGNASAIARLGVDVESMREQRRRLVSCDIVPFGPDGPWRSIPAHGNNLDALAACGRLTAGDGPVQMAAQIYGGVSNEVGAHQATSAILAALLRAERTGIGADLTVSCWEAAIEANRVRLLFPELAQPSDPSIDEQVNGSRHTVYWSADDRPMYLSAIDVESWRRFCHATGQSELRDAWPAGAQSDYGDSELTDVIAAVFAQRTAAEWMAVFPEARVAATPLLTEREVLDSAQLEQSGMVDGGSGRPGLALPVRWDGSTGRFGHRRAESPELGADNDRIRPRWLGNQ